MNVSREGFRQALSILEEVLPAAAFVAFDLEMTGIQLPAHKISMGQTPAERYQHMRAVASTFTVVQFGLAVFERGATAGAPARVRPFNFFVFPEEIRDLHYPSLTLNAGALRFLRDNGLDLNEWVSNGVPFVDRATQEALKEQLLAERPAEARNDKTVVLSRDDDKTFVAEAMTRVGDWVARNDPSEKEVVISDCNSFLRLALRQRIGAAHPELVIEKRPLPDNRYRADLAVLRLTDEEKLAREEAKRAEREAEYIDKIGMRRVFELLAHHKKPMVGHHCLYDFLFTMNWFQDALPATLGEFKTALHTAFPEVVDTKYFMTVRPELGLDGEGKKRVKSTSLGDLFSGIFPDGVPASRVEFPEGFRRYVEVKQAHEAGYDALMTGCVYLEYLDRLAASEIPVAPLGNRFYLMRSVVGLAANPADPDPLLLADTVSLHVAGFSDTTDTKEILSWFGPFADSGSALWIDSSSTFLNFVEPSVSAKIETADQSPIDALLDTAKHNLQGRDDIVVQSLLEYTAGRDGKRTLDEGDDGDAKRGRV